MTAMNRLDETRTSLASAAMLGHRDPDTITLADPVERAAAISYAMTYMAPHEVVALMIHETGRAGLLGTWRACQPSMRQLHRRRIVVLVDTLLDPPMMAEYTTNLLTREAA